ncbi:MAG: alcohol dehydrogenase, partial [Planctomycetota bacterium]|nr:alcohol dehydrogenase [Planctomycetota bacterium]
GSASGGKHQNCTTYVFTRSKEHQELAVSLGAEWTGQAQETPPRQMDCGIIFAPSGELVPLALKNLKKGGRLILAGIHMSPIPEMPYNLIYEEREIKSVANSTRDDVRDFLKLAGEIPIRTMVTTFPLAEAQRALTLLKQGKIRGSGVIDLISAK